MKFKEMSPQDKVDFAARYIIVHSIIYYEMDESVISDKKFDKKAQALVRLINKYPEEVKNSEYFQVIHDFDGSTGFHLYHRLKKSQRRYLKQIARHVIRCYKKDISGE